eukprot:PhF_6_TR11254/c0_g2_i1/m.18155
MKSPRFIIIGTRTVMCMGIARVVIHVVQTQLIRAMEPRGVLHNVTLGVRRSLPRNDWSQLYVFCLYHFFSFVASVVIACILFTVRYDGGSGVGDRSFGRK